MNAFGIYGVGVMGRGLALNLASKGHRVSIYNKEVERVVEVVEDGRIDNIHNIFGYDTVKDFMKSLQFPRKVLMMVPAGKPVCDVIASMSPYLKRGDILIDGGNEWYQQTQNRQEMVRWRYGVELIGMGVSGGAHGARYGAAFMPGGDRASVETILPFLRDASDPHSEVAYVGAGGSGNFVKMVHNGIEYAIMQAISEIYSVLKNMYHMDNESIAAFFDDHEFLNSYLLEITAQILRTSDDDGSQLIDKILDVPQMNGTGAWTAKEAFDTLVSCPTIISAIDARIIASTKSDRIVLSTLIPPSNIGGYSDMSWVSEVLIVAMHMAYLQGFQLITAKSKKENWGVNTKNLAKNWMGGCIIRSNLLGFFANTETDAYLYASFEKYSNKLPIFARFVSESALSGIYCPTICATYQYMLGYTTAALPTNLIQAQRDYFGAHGYERTDKPGKFRTKWH